jgi:hypothetical protein
MTERGPSDAAEMQPVRLTPTILAPRHLVCVLIEILTADPVMDAVLGAPQPREERLGLIYVGAIGGDELDRMVDAASLVRGVQHIPAARFIGMYDGAGRNVFADHGNRSAFARHDERQCPAENLACDNDNLALASLFFGKPAVDTLGFPVFWLDVSASVHAVNMNGARKLRLVRVVNLRTHGLAQLVRQYESRFVLNV